MEENKLNVFDSEEVMLDKLFNLTRIIHPQVTRDLFNSIFNKFIKKEEDLIINGREG
jgi:hypothetical protein